MGRLTCPITKKFYERGMKMDIYQAIDLRRTVRDFSDKAIDLDVLKKVLNAGLKAPSNDHLRRWEFIVLSDMESRLNTIDKVQKKFSVDETLATMNEWGLKDECQRDMYLEGIPKQYSMLLEAGALIIPVFKQRLPLLKPKNLSALNGFVSIWCCIENILLAAAAEGIFGVTRIPFEAEVLHIKETLHIPEDYEIPCYLAMGYPREDIIPVRQLPVNVDERIHFNKW
jgi:nitroreductase